MHAEARGGLTHGRAALALRLAPLQPSVLVDDLQLEAQRAPDAAIALAQAAPLEAAVLAPGAHLAPVLWCDVSHFRFLSRSLSALVLQPEKTAAEETARRRDGPRT